MTKNNENHANTQAQKAGNGGTIPPKERQFGQPNGNKQGRGFWKKEATARYKLEKMLELTEAELTEIVNDKDAPYFERKLAKCISKGQWNEIQGMMNQVYGMPRQEIKQTNIEVPAPRLPKNKTEE